MKVRLQDLYRKFLLLGIQLLGGGYVIVPLIQQSIIDKHNWITNEELTDFYALSQSIPGIIAANTAIFTGRKLLGRKGAIAATIGIVLPSFLAIVLLASILSEIVDKPSVQHIFWGVGIGVITLLFLAVKEMWTKCVVDKFSICVYSVCLILAFTRVIPLSLIVILALVSGIIFQRIEDKKNLKNNKGDEKC